MKSISLDVYDANPPKAGFSQEGYPLSAYAFWMGFFYDGKKRCNTENIGCHFQEPE